MPDRENVIKGLECIVQQAQNGTCGECAYFRPFTDDPDCGWCDKVAIENDALALLREQKPVKVVMVQNIQTNTYDWVKKQKFVQISSALIAKKS